jgi:hypothetical protein
MFNLKKKAALKLRRRYGVTDRRTNVLTQEEFILTFIHFDFVNDT